MKHGYDFTWYPTMGEKCSVNGSWFDSKEEADAHRNRVLTTLGYTKPKWWQWWRWKEYPLDVV